MSTSPSEAVAAALRASKAANVVQTAMTEESRLLLVSMIRDEMRTAVAEGISTALTDEQIWRTIVAAIQEAAIERTGKFVLGGLSTVLKKLGWLILGLLALYAIGGFAALKAAWVALFRN